MKAVEINKTGGPEVLEVKDISLDKPGPDQVTIEQKAIGLNYIDTYHRSGLYPVELPSKIGIEGAGIIEKIGPDVKDFNVGDKVEVTGCAPAGINTESASVTAVTGPNPFGISGNASTQSGTVTLNYGDANLSATDGAGEIRKVVKVAVRGSGKTHISEVQIVGDF